MKTTVNDLVSQYARRGFVACLGAVLAVSTMGGVVSDLLAQSGSATAQTMKPKPKSDAKPASALTVTPVPRKGRGGKGATVPSGQTPGAQPKVAPGAMPAPGGAGVVPITKGGPGGAPPSPGVGAPPSDPGAGGHSTLRGAIPTGTLVSFDFHDADISNVLKLYAQMSGLTVITAEGLSGKVTIINPKQVPIDDAFRILQSVLSVRGFTALQSGPVLSIVPLDRAIGSTTQVNSDSSPMDLNNRDMVMTQVIPLENVDAEAMAKELLPLVNKGASLIGSPGTNALILTDTASNVQRFMKLVDALDKTSTRTEMRVYPLKRAEAGALADIINNLYTQITSRGRGGGGAPQPGQPPPQPGQPGAPAGGRPAVVAVADTRTNSVLIVASPDNQEQIAQEIINRLDGNNDNTLDTKIRKIKYADAATVASLVSNVLSNMHGTSGAQSGSSFQSRAFGGYGQFGSGGGGGDQGAQSTDPFGKIVAEPRTNSVVITASTERMAKINELIDRIDVDVPVETTTFVIPVKNAQASDLAYTLTEAFGTANQNNGGNSYYNFGGGNNQGNGSTNRQPIQRRLGSSSSSTGRGVVRPSRSNFAPAPPNAPDGGTAGDGAFNNGNSGSAIPNGVAGVMTDQGFVPTGGVDPANEPNGPTRQAYYRGGYYGGYGGGQQRGIGQSGGPVYGRGSGGSYVNLLQLQNNVFVTASPNGDSLIVTTTPDNILTIKNIIEQLDVQPRQVMIEVVVAEVTLDTDQKFGFNVSGTLSRLFHSATTGQGQGNFPANGSPGGTALDAAASGFQFLLSGTNYAALLQALTNDSKVKVLSTPKVFTSNNQQAEIDITTNVPYISGQLSGGFSTTVNNNVQFLQVGFILNVTPRITRQGLVTIDVKQEASDLLRYVTLGTGTSAISAPEVNDRYADTSVTVQDGETIALGGLIRDSNGVTVAKVPLLGDIPLIGQFFRSREKTRNKVELMIFMTPHVVNNPEEARDLARREGVPVIKQIPDLIKQQPQLDGRPGHSMPPSNRTPGSSGTGSQGALPIPLGSHTPTDLPGTIPPALGTDTQYNGSPQPAPSPALPPR